MQCFLNGEIQNIPRLVAVRKKDPYNFLQPWRILDWHSRVCLKAARTLAFVCGRNEGNYLCLSYSLPSVISPWRGWKEIIWGVTKYIYTPSRYEAQSFHSWSRQNNRGHQVIDTWATWTLCHLSVMYFLRLCVKACPQSCIVEMFERTWVHYEEHSDLWQVVILPLHLCGRRDKKYFYINGDFQRWKDINLYSVCAQYL